MVHTASNGLSHDSPFAPRLLVHVFAVLVAVHHSTFLTTILSPVSAHRTNHPWRLARRGCNGSQIGRDCRGIAGYALTVVASKLSSADHKQTVNRALTDSSVKRAKFFLYRTAVRIFIVDFFFLPSSAALLSEIG